MRKITKIAVSNSDNLFAVYALLTAHIQLCLFSLQKFGINTRKQYADGRNTVTGGHIQVQLVCVHLIRQSC